MSPLYEFVPFLEIPAKVGFVVDWTVEIESLNVALCKNWHKSQNIILADVEKYQLNGDYQHIADIDRLFLALETSVITDLRY